MKRASLPLRVQAVVAAQIDRHQRPQPETKMAPAINATGASSQSGVDYSSALSALRCGSGSSRTLNHSCADVGRTSSKVSEMVKSTRRQTLRAPVTNRAIQISKHAPMKPQIR